MHVRAVGAPHFGASARQRVISKVRAVLCAVRRARVYASARSCLWMACDSLRVYFVSSCLVARSLGSTLCSCRRNQLRQFPPRNHVGTEGEEANQAPGRHAGDRPPQHQEQHQGHAQRRPGARLGRSRCRAPVLYVCKTDTGDQIEHAHARTSSSIKSNALIVFAPFLLVSPAAAAPILQSSTRKSST